MNLLTVWKFEIEAFLRFTGPLSLERFATSVGR